MDEPDLPERVTQMLVRCPYAQLVGRTMATRLEHIVDIVSLHTRDELSRQRGLGRATVRKIEKWLEFHGRRLRGSNESIDSVICGFEFRKRHNRRPRSRNAAKARENSATVEEPWLTFTLKRDAGVRGKRGRSSCRHV
jgi:hypothetical protein